MYSPTDDYHLDMLLKKNLVAIEQFNQRLVQANKVLTHLNKRKLVCRDDIASLESFHQKAIAKRINSFTTLPTKTNLQATLEGTLKFNHMMRVGILGALAAILAGIAAWLLTGSKDSDGAKGSSRADNMSKVTSMINAQAAHSTAAVARLREIVEAQEEYLKNPTNVALLHKHLIDAQSTEVLNKITGSLATDIVLDHLLESSIGKHINQPIIVGFISDKDTVVKPLMKHMVEYAKYLYPKVKADLEKLNHAVQGDSKPDGLSTMADLAKGLDTILASVNKSITLKPESPGDAVSAINKYFSESLTQAPGTYTTVDHKALLNGGLSNAVTIAHELLDMEKDVESESEGFVKESELLATLSSGEKGVSEKALYGDAIDTVKKYSLVLVAIVGNVRKVEDAMKKLGTAIDSSIVSFLTVLSTAEKNIKADEKAPAEQKDKAVAFIIELKHSLNEIKKGK